MKKSKKRKKSKTTFSLKSGISNRRKSVRAITYDDRNYKQDMNYPSLSRPRNTIPGDRDSVMNQNEFLPSISNRVDRRGANFAWID
jgi:carbamoylphosphate synthase large subunit